MQRVTMVRYTTLPERTAENEKLVRSVFTELREKTPANIAYATFRNGDEFLHLFVNTKEGDASVLTELPSFKIFGEAVSTRCAVPPEVSRHDFEMLDSYGLPR